MNLEFLKTYIEANEGHRKFPYQDVKGLWTIGIGRNLSQRGLSESEINYLFENDIDYTIENLQTLFPDYQTWTENRQVAIADMLFNLGYTRFVLFQKLIEYLREKQWSKAADEIQRSNYFIQLTKRATKNMQMVETG